MPNDHTAHRVSSASFCGSPASPDTDLHRRQPNSLVHTSSNISLRGLYTPPSSTSLLQPYPHEKLGVMNGSPKPAGSPGLLPPLAINATKSMDATPRFLGMPLKYVSLVTLAVQNASLTIIMHYSRVSTPANRTYSAASAVLLNELLKGLISLLIALVRIDDQPTKNRLDAIPLMSSSGELDEGAPTTPMVKAKAQGRGLHGRNGSGTIRGVIVSQLRRSTCLVTRLWSKFRRLGREVFSPDCWKLSIPAILYVIQNNLQFVAASNLDVATFQVTYQMKILTTAAFSVMLLRKRLSKAKWGALFCLAVGVGIVQIQSTAPAKEATQPPLDGLDPVIEAAAATAAHKAREVVGQAKHVMNPLKGFAAVSAACVTSGLAGVYFEMVLKGSQADLWVRNVQLSLFSLLPALVPIIFNNAGASADGRSFSFSLFANFSGWAWATVLTQVFGGLITAVVIKYSDNIMKGFATSLSIVLSFLASVALFDFRITLAFVIGSTTVLAATWMYNQAEIKAPSPAKLAVASGTRESGSHSGASSAFPPGSPVAEDAPILGEMIKKKPSSSFPSPRNIAVALRLVSTEDINGSAFVNGNHSANLTPGDANPYSYSPGLQTVSLSGSHTPLGSNNRSGIATPASWSRPPSRASSARPLAAPGSNIPATDNGSSH